MLVALGATASVHAAPSAMGAVPTGAQPMWPTSLVVALPSMSTIQVHFSPVLQPVCATGLQANWLSIAASRSCGLPPPPHAAAKATTAAPRIRFFMCATPVAEWQCLQQSSPGTRADTAKNVAESRCCTFGDDDLGHATWRG